MHYATCVFPKFMHDALVKAVFVELPAFERYRAQYLDDSGFLDLQLLLMKNPTA